MQGGWPGRKSQISGCKLVFAQDARLRSGVKCFCGFTVHDHVHMKPTAVRERAPHDSVDDSTAARDPPVISSFKICDLMVEPKLARNEIMLGLRS